MKVYFVRHGQTDFNREKVHQFPDTALSKLGESQAEFIGTRFRSIQIDAIFSSPYKRAYQTAEQIHLSTKANLSPLDLLTEKLQPSILRGKTKDDPEVIPIKKLLKENAHNPDWHYSDEENLYDLKKRSQKLIAHLENLKLESIAVVTHGTILSMIALLILFPEDLVDHRLFKEFDDRAHATNTGLSYFEFNDGKWKMHTWNDFAHLGE